MSLQVHTTVMVVVVVAGKEKGRGRPILRPSPRLYIPSTNLGWMSKVETTWMDGASGGQTTEKEGWKFGAWDAATARKGARVHAVASGSSEPNLLDSTTISWKVRTMKIPQSHGKATNPSRERQGIHSTDPRGLIECSPSTSLGMELGERQPL